ncbi:thioredoxin [Guyparkeria sp.]|uniref:thioredoxin n=1 Tax=Guyparkeria sp. TaxID=2035736 RepID=UPI0035694706
MSESENVFSVATPEFADKVLDASRETPVLVDFWAEWCGPCRQLMPLLSEVVESMNGQVKLAKVNTEEEQELAQQFGVRSLPTVMMFVGGRPVDQFQGALPEGQIREFIGRHVLSEIDKLRREAQQVRAAGAMDQAMDLLKQANQQEPGNVEVLLDIADLIAEQGDLDQAWEILESLPVDAATRDDVKAFKARIGMARSAQSGPPEDELRARIEKDPKDCEAREALAAKLAMRNDIEGALEQYYQMMLRDRAYNDEAGRRGMVDLFEMLGGEHPLTRQYRRKMFGLLH